MRRLDGWNVMGATTLLGAIFLLATVTTAGARPGGEECDGEHRRGGLERRVESLDLDAETTAAVYEVLDRGRDGRRVRGRELRAAREQLRELLAVDEPVLEDVMAQADAIGGLETAAHRLRLETMLALRDLLDAEQWAELQEGRGRRGGERGRRGPRRG